MLLLQFSLTKTIFFPFDFHSIHICIASGAKLSFASVFIHVSESVRA